MTQTICDKCGSTVPPQDKKALVGMIFKDDSGIHKPDFHKDLCVKCYEEVKTWVRNRID